MSKLKVLCFSLSLDGFGAGVNQSLDNPMGINGMSLHEWVFPTKSFKAMHSEMMGEGDLEGTTGIDNDYATGGFENIGAWILGRNMFSPFRGNWEDHPFNGWWGENPPYHTPVYVLTHHARPSLEMKGGTIFHFVTDGIEVALKLAKEGAKGKDIRVGGGVNTIRQYLNAKLLDEIHIAVAPTFLGEGENLFQGINLPKLGYECVEYAPSEKAVHIVLKLRKQGVI
ncbi:MAG: dihydrofolate reductase [Leptospiraceae bacterium]|nr:dihydrofolate reductase [Leptospiraceae bacterium]MCP5493457.1 dihydrofolate reductase [Leptospiraceae bacterium]